MNKRIRERLHKQTIPRQVSDYKTSSSSSSRGRGRGRGRGGRGGRLGRFSGRGGRSYSGRGGGLFSNNQCRDNPPLEGYYIYMLTERSYILIKLTQLVNVVT